MTKKIKRGLALLAAGVLLTSSAAAYAAQLPNGNETGALAPASSQLELGVDINLRFHTLTADRIHALFYVRPTGMDSLQFRYANYHVLVETETGAGTGIYRTVVDEDQGDSPNAFELDEAISIEEGARVHVRLTVSGRVFLGYTPVGNAEGTQDFYFTL